ncbi:MAG TPA: pseudouridine synthase [Cyclobacteriaceae bacterium]|nr:pseudouridine synthase [Cyclobacteriaceae bacterium]
MNKRIVFADLILHEDENFIAISKPSGISSLEDRQGSRNILEMARKYWPECQVCHRLDKETSGVMILSKNQETYRYMSILFESREVTKIYHAVCDGLHQFKKTGVDAAIKQHSNGKVVIDKKSGKPSQTYFNSLKAFGGHTLVECRPITGRIHQVRIHLAMLGAPITGDLEYGGKYFFLSSVKKGYKLGKFEEERPLISRLALHAKSIRFAMPSGKKVTINSPYPKDFRVLLAQLERYSTHHPV